MNVHSTHITSGVEEDSASSAGNAQARTNGQVAPKRIAIYTHDTWGMGHVRRCFNIVEALCAEHGDWPVLFISGSPALSKFDDRPKNVDILKLPTLAPTGEVENLPAHLPLSPREITRMRKRIIKSALQAFEPDIFLVDNFPLGARKELAPSLQMLRTLPTQSVLGLRDIVEDPGKTRERWQKEGVYDALCYDYDHLLIYGHKEILDAGEAYALPDAAKNKLHYSGYVARTLPEAPRQRQKSPDKKLDILVTVGGGGDGLPLLKSFFEATKDLTPFKAQVVAGPMMGEKDRSFVHQEAGKLNNVTVTDYLPNLLSHMAAADVVLCMGGYNTSAELIGLQRRAIIVPRDWRFGQHAIGVGAGEEKEQMIRAEAMAANGYARVILPSQMNAKTLAEAIKAESEIDPDSYNMVPLSISGARTVAEFLTTLPVKCEEGV